MRKIYNFLLLTLIINNGISQTQIDNAGFENWENAGTTLDEPTDWSSIKTSDDATLNGFAPVVWGQSTDAHSGSYSLELINVSTFGVVANGTVTNGRVHADFDPNNGYVFTDIGDNTWNQSFTDKPDSLVGWVKYTPSGSDKGKLHAILHTSNGQIPENGTMSNWVAEARINFSSANSSWLRFAAPFNYYSSTNPEYILLVLTSGDSTVAIDGSVALVDDLELIYNPASIFEPSSSFNMWFSENSLYTNMASSIECGDLKIYEVMGKLVSSFKVNSYVNNHIYLDLPAGIYIAEMTTKTTRKTLKLFIE